MIYIYVFDFVSLPEDVLFVPRTYCHLADRYLLSENEEPSSIPKNQSSDNEFIEVVHVV
jgi:hypothetical protein